MEESKSRRRPAFPKVFIAGRTGVRQAALVRAYEAPFGKHRVHVLGAKRSIVIDAGEVHADPEAARAAIREVRP